MSEYESELLESIRNLLTEFSSSFDGNPSIFEIDIAIFDSILNFHSS